MIALAGLRKGSIFIVSWNRIEGMIDTPNGKTRDFTTKG